MSEDLARQLEDARRDRDAFLFSVTHDLRAPLRAVRGFAAALEEDYGSALDDTGRTYVARIQSAAHQLDSRIRDLGDLYRIERADAGEVSARVHAAIDEALHALREKVESTGAAVEVAAEVPSVAVAHRVLAAVFERVLDNALTYVPPGVAPQVAVRARVDGDRVEVVVSDLGIGIAQTDADRIFEVFERLHGVETYPGNGVGLAYVRAALARVGGAIRLTPSEGQGATFVLHLPLGSSPCAETDLPEIDNSLILVVEDDPDDAALLRRAFDKARLTNPLYFATDGEEAMAYLLGEAPFDDRNRHPMPAIILLDLNLPRVSGFEVLERLRRDPALHRLPVVVMTGSTSDPDVNRAYDLGANSYVVKPVTFGALSDMVQTLRLYWLILNRRPDVPDE